MIINGATRDEAPPRHRAGGDLSGRISGRQCGQLRGGDAGMLARILVKIPPPQGRPKNRQEAESDE